MIWKYVNVSIEIEVSRVPTGHRQMGSRLLSELLDPEVTKQDLALLCLVDLKTQEAR